MIACSFINPLWLASVKEGDGIVNATLLLILLKCKHVSKKQMKVLLC